MRTLMLGSLLAAQGMAGLAHGQTPLDPVIQACVAPDGVLRLARLGTTCPAGQQRVLFKRAESDATAPPADDAAAKPGATCTASDEAALVALGRRLQALEGAGRGTIGPSRVTAPFEVVDKAGRLVFQVAEDAGGARFVLAYNQAGTPVAGIRATSGGGLLWGEAATRDRRVLVGAGKSFTGLDVEEGAVDSGKNRIRLGRIEASGRYSLRVNRDNGEIVAGIGENAAGGGLAFVSDASGKQRALMVPGSDVTRTGFYVNGRDGAPVAVLVEGDRGGWLQLFAGTQVMVEAGVADGGYGVVRAGPASFKPGYGLLGLPGSYIAGKAN
ncbi:MAG: hypothetical protein IT522_09480 [Burkholderiales bacterium]|nr:hypothetical protein [Burkholderiales bacterium]